MIKKLGLLIALIVFSAATFAKTIILRSMTGATVNGVYHITLQLSGSTQYREKLIRHPARYVIDLKNVTTVRRLHLPLSSQSFVTGYRYATHSDGIFRLVLNLKKTITPQVKTFFNPKNHSVRLTLLFSKLSLPAPGTITAYDAHTMMVSQKPHYHAALPNPDAELTSSRRDVLIVIDPGHGGKDPGAIGIAGTKEKNVVLSISRLLQAQINQQPGFHAVLTRTSDYYLTLRERLAIARKDKADMFVAIHADKWRNTSAKGVSVFALSQRGATSEAARWLAHRENKSELMGGVKLQDQSHLLSSVLINLSQSATIRASLMIGKDIMQAVRPIARLHHARVEQAAFVVLKSPDIPSLLVETGFLSNPSEESRLCNPQYQAKLAMAIFKGIRQYFVTYPPRGTLLAWKQGTHGH